MILLATSAIDATLRDSISLIIPEASLIGAACVLFLLSTVKASRSIAGVIALLAFAVAGLLHETIRARPR